MKRRTWLQVSASLAFLGVAPAFALPRHCALMAGLPTDEAFAQGTGLSHRLTLRAGAQGYAALVQTLRDTADMSMLALVDAQHALLLEQAARDSGAAVVVYRPVLAKHALDAGRHLANGTATSLPQHATGALVAIHLKT